MVCYIEGEKHADDSTPDASCSEPTISQSRASSQGISDFFDLHHWAASFLLYDTQSQMLLVALVNILWFFIMWKIKHSYKVNIGHQ